MSWIDALTINFGSNLWKESIMRHSIRSDMLHQHTLIETYVQKNRCQNWLWLFGPTWFAVTKQLQIFVFFVLRLQFQKLWRVLYIIGKVFSKTFERYITCPQIPNIWVAKQKKDFSSLVTTNHVGQKDRSQFWMQFLFT